jgi:hypothetical protein
MTVSFHPGTGMGELRVTGFRCSENDPPKLTPTSKLAGTPISDDKTVAKMGHPMVSSVGRCGPPVPDQSVGLGEEVKSANGG